MGFTPNGELQLQLFLVGTDEKGERDYRSIVDVTDTLDNMRDVWFYALGRRLGITGDDDALVMPISATADKAPDAEDKPKRGRPRKQAAPTVGPAMAAGGGANGTAATVTGPAVAQVATGVPADPLHAPEDQTAPAPAPAPPAPARVNPFTQG